MADLNSMLKLLKQDLQRTGTIPGEDEYLQQTLQAALSSLERQGIREETTADWIQIAVGTAAWIYRKRINGEEEPQYLRRMRMDLLMSQKARVTSDAT